jgi:membrane fusion protein (multidrug efflux system)
MISPPDSAALRLLSVLALLALSACEIGNGSPSSAGAAGDADAEDEKPPVPVEVSRAIRGDVYAVYTGTASLESDEEALVVAKVGGEVEKIFVEEGDVVRAGQVLARLDGDRLRLEMEQTRANLQKLQQEYERNVELNERGLVSAGAFESIKFDLDSQRAAYSLAKLELDYTEIKAPIAGIVSERFIKVGNTISINDPVFNVTDLDPLLAYLFVPEREFRKLTPGQQADVTLDAIPGERFEAEILRISPVVDPQTGTFKVTLAVQDEGARLKPGMFGRFQIVYDARQDAVLVPRIALVDDDERQSVFVVEEGEARRREVRVGYSRGENVEIVEGVAAGEAVVTIGQTGLAEGARVEVVGAEPATDDDAEVELATPEVGGATGQDG